MHLKLENIYCDRTYQAGWRLRQINFQVGKGNRLIRPFLSPWGLSRGPSAPHTPGPEECSAVGWVEAAFRGRNPTSTVGAGSWRALLANPSSPTVSEKV